MFGCFRVITAKLEVPAEVWGLLKKQGYKRIGSHSALKPCHWFRMGMLEGRLCYKSWYGINSRRCIQMSPMVIYCTHKCIYCWRMQSGDVRGVTWKEVPEKGLEYDDPEEIAEKSIEVQRMCVIGYKGDERVTSDRLREALTPKHAAISLSGEPTLYPYLSGLIEAYKRRGLTTFVVTNGTLPERLENLDVEPSQLYVTLPAPDKKTYVKVCRPLIPNGWEKLMKTLKLLESFSCPTVIRITLVKGYNLKDPEGYAKLIEMANPTYVEPKAAMCIGYARYRITPENMPKFNEVKVFAEKLSSLTGYEVIKESEASRVCLLSTLKEPIKVT